MAATSTQKYEVSGKTKTEARIIRLKEVSKMQKECCSIQKKEHKVLE